MVHGIGNGLGNRLIGLIGPGFHVFQEVTKILRLLLVLVLRIADLMVECENRIDQLGTADIVRTRLGNLLIQI
ncbi:hypothetical protein GS08_02470 [Bifidobacterium longum]|uniref:Uncharacterized protein n=1 Tax=Bifidobacterium longum TaxID=216816 RepID=A0A7U4KDA4_BIFLN|nr:hypothetical protein GS08_02470 [Bifidobacterium longum]